MSSITRNQASGAYRRWELPDFDAPPEPPPLDIEPPPQDPAQSPEAQAGLPEGFKLPTAEDVEQIFEEARKSGYAAGYEEATARGRMEAMKLHGLVESFDAALAGFDQNVSEQLLDCAVELARQLLRRELRSVPETVVEVVREALQQMPQNHAMVHLHPEDAALVREYLGEQLAHLGHRLIEDDGVTRGGCRIEASGSQLDATLQTRWQRIMANLGRDDPLEAAE